MSIEKKYQSAIKHDIDFFSSIRFYYASLLDQLIVIPFEEKYLASKKGMPQDLHQIRYH